MTPPTTVPSTRPPSGRWTSRGRNSAWTPTSPFTSAPARPPCRRCGYCSRRPAFRRRWSSPHEKTGVRPVSIPFDIAAEYVPAVLRGADEKLTRLTVGLPPESPEFDAIIGRSPSLERARGRARRVAPHDVTVLIEGESGTGKELFARAIHAESRRRGGPFEEVNCGALPEGLVESLLFGHTRGAFSGAIRAHAGHFETAAGGTLFLDEIGELRPDAQVKLLRALQEQTVRRLGSDRAIRVDVRIIAATNRDLLAEVSAGRFREDLYLPTGRRRHPPPAPPRA